MPELDAIDLKILRTLQSAGRLTNAEVATRANISAATCHRRTQRLFDEGYITFSSSQELVIVPEVRDKLLDAWGIDAGVRVGDFSREQNAYLDYHRTNVFKRALLEG